MDDRLRTADGGQRTPDSLFDFAACAARHANRKRPKTRMEATSPSELGHGPLVHCYAAALFIFIPFDIILVLLQFLISFRISHLFIVLFLQPYFFLSPFFIYLRRFGSFCPAKELNRCQPS